MKLKLIALDILFELAHVGIILFALFGWLFPELRLAHLYLLLLILFSWVLLGFFYHFGYCFLTALHWKIKEKLGKEPHVESYITYALHQLGFNQARDPGVDLWTDIGFFILLTLSLVLNAQYIVA